MLCLVLFVLLLALWCDRSADVKRPRCHAKVSVGKRASFAPVKRLIVSFVSAIALVHPFVGTTAQEIYPRQLVVKDESKGRRRKVLRRRSLLAEASTSRHYATPTNFTKLPWCQAHSSKGPAIFAAAMSAALMPFEAKRFVGTARKAGFAGDIV